MPRRRRTKKTRLLYSEGAQDKAFLDYLKTVYSSECYNVDIKRGAGGNQIDLVNQAYKKGRPYGEVFLKLDGDRDSAEMAAADTLADELGVIILRSTPAIEKLLLNILEPDKGISSWSTKRMKGYLEKEYIPPVKRTDSRAYADRFNKDVLEEARARLPELESILRLF